MFNYQLYLEQMKANPYAALQMQKMMGVLGQGQGQMPGVGMQGGVIPFSKLPFNQKPQEEKKEEKTTAKG